MDYWREHAEIAMSEAGITGATDEQLNAIAGVIESAHDFYGQAMGYDVASSNLKAAQERAHQDALRRVEQEKERELEAMAKRTDDIRRDRERLRFALQDARRRLAEATR